VPVEDIYMSTNGGVDWVDQATGPGKFPEARYHGAAVADANNALYIIEGRTNHGESKTDVWKSATQGRSWTMQSLVVPWGQRGVNLAVATTLNC
jgi:N-acetylneuraminic acid mutarotase